MAIEKKDVLTKAERDMCVLALRFHQKSFERAAKTQDGSIADAFTAKAHAVQALANKMQYGSLDLE